MRFPRLSRYALRTLVASAGIAVSFATAVRADTIVLTNGDRLTGTVTHLTGGKIGFDTPDAGTVSIDMEAVASIVTVHPVTIVLKDYTRISGRLTQGTTAFNVSPVDGSASQQIDPRRISSLSPVVQQEDRWRLTGRLGVGVADVQGNTQVRRFNTDDELVARRGRDRWTFGLRAAQTTQNSNEAEANANTRLKYDRFVSERLYVFGGSSLEHDRLKSLRLRATIGAGAGFQGIETSTTTLSVESSLDRIRTDYFRGPDNLSWAMQVAIRFDHWVLPDRVQVFHMDQNFLDLSDLGHSFVRTQTGVRLPLRAGLMLTVELDLDWDGNPSPGRRSVDRTLAFNFGYKW